MYIHYVSKRYDYINEAVEFAEELDKEKEFGYIKIEKIDEPKLKKKCTIS